MLVNRRRLLLGSLALVATPARAQTEKPQGLDAAQFGVRAHAGVDQTRQLQRAIDRAAQAQQPLWLATGTYRSGPLTLRGGSQIVGGRGARIVLTRGPSLLAAHDAEGVALTGLALDGGNTPLGRDGALVAITGARNLRINDCAIANANGNAIGVFRSTGTISGNSIAGSADNALYCVDNTGVIIRGNKIAKSGNGGIRVWQSVKRNDGSIVENNIIEDTEARAGGSGQNGNAINIFRAAGVTVRGNTIRRAAFSAVRGNAASHIKILENQCYELGEVAIYSEFEFEDATIVNNIVDGAAVGVAVTNYDKGGRGAVVRGNVIRNVVNKRPQGGPDSYGVGIGVEADTLVTGNTIVNAPVMGIEVGSGKYLHNVTVTGNTVRQTGIGIGVSVVQGAGSATITDNLIVDAKGGAIRGMAWDKAVTGDLALGGAARYPRLRVSGNKTG